MEHCFWTFRDENGVIHALCLVYVDDFMLACMSLLSWHSSRLKRVARSSSAAETQAAADGDDEAVHIRLYLKEVLFGQLYLQNWQSETGQILAALVVDCRGVYDALARSSSSCLGLKDKKSGLEALALKQSLVECGTVVRWCHWKLVHDPKFESSRSRAQRGLDILEKLMKTSLQTTFHEIRRVSR